MDIEAINALLIQTEEAHGVFEETELKGVYDREWSNWYAAYVVEHGIGALVGHTITTELLARFLETTNIEFERAEPRPDEPWPAYTAARIAADL